VVTKSHPGRMYTRRGELNKQESSDQLIESAEGLDC
jgi:rRNA maturation protein Rpf1